MFEPYLIPQDCGLRCDNRWLAMSNKSGLGLRFAMDEPFNFNAYHYSTDNLTKAVYTYQLQKQDGITLNLDYNTTGVGCTACYVLPGYQVKPAVRPAMCCPAIRSSPPVTSDISQYHSA